MLQEQPEYIENRQIRIFISSTFKDMQAEREYLVTRVFPGLRKYCEERDVSLFELDLRWGVTQEDSENQKAFKICLDEVHKTKPFFIGLLGERYGWVPSEDQLKKMTETHVFDEYPWVQDELKNKVSITETEILAGALRPKERTNAFFYIRSPKMEILDGVEYKDPKGSDEEKMLRELKKKIKNDKRYLVQDYDNVEHLGELVKIDFEALVNHLFPNKEHLSDLEKERLQQRAYLKSKTRVYVENPDWNNTLNEFVEGAEKAIVITGERGMGKSALLANWITYRQNERIENENIIYHFIGISQSEGDYHKIIQRLINEVQDIYNIHTVEGEQTFSRFNKEMDKQNFENQKDKLKDRLQNLLLLIPDNKKLIIILDSLECLYDTYNAKMLDWIPVYPKNVKIIYSSPYDDKSKEVLSHREYRQIIVNVLSIETRKNLITKYLDIFSKKLLPVQVERIASSKDSENPLVLLSILDNLRVFGNFEFLDQQIEEHLTQDSYENLFDLILQSIERSFIEGNSPKGLVKEILSLIAVSRYGLTETEILKITGNATPLYWSQLFNSMSRHLIMINGYVTISNKKMLTAIENRYLKDSNTKQLYQNKIATYMKTDSEVLFERKCDELPYQLYALNEWNKLYNFLFDHEVFTYIYTKDTYTIENYWRVLQEKDINKYSIERYLSLEDTIEKKDDLVFFYNCISNLLLHNLFNFSLALKFALRNSELCKIIYGENNTKTIDSYEEINSIYNAMDEKTKALEYSKRTLAIRKIIFGKEHINIAKSYNIIGSDYSSLGENEKALDFFNDAIRISKEYYSKNNINLELENAYTGISNCYFNMKEYEKSLEYNSKVTSLIEKRMGKKHPSISGNYLNISLCYSNLNMHEKAIEYAKKVLEINKLFFGKEYNSVYAAYFNLAICYKRSEKYEKAIEYYFKALNIQEKYFGKEFYFNAGLYYNIGNCYSSLTDNKKALEYYFKALILRENFYGKENSFVAIIYDKIGFCYTDLNDFQNAIKYYKEELEINKKLFGKEHLNTADSYYKIACCYALLVDYKNAIENFIEVLEIRKKIFVGNHPDIASSYNDIGTCYYSIGNYENALDHYKQAYSIYSSLTGYESITESLDKNIEYLTNQIPSDLYSTKDQYNEAIKNLTEAIKLNPNDVNFIGRGSIYYTRRQFDEAINDFTEAIKLNPNRADYYFTRGYCYLYRSQYNEAIKDFKNSINLDPNSPAHNVLYELFKAGYK